MIGRLPILCRFSQRHMNTLQPKLMMGASTSPAVTQRIDQQSEGRFMMQPA
jgi:hypothetical protein